MHRTARDAGDVLTSLEKRVGLLERRGRGFSIPQVEAAGGTIASDTPPPAPSDPGILWIDTDDGNKIYRWNGSAWTPAMDPKVDLDRNEAATALASWQDATASGDGLVTLYRQSSAPGASGLAVGDLWVDSDTNGLWRWSGSSWGNLGDTSLGALLSGPNLSSTVADGRVRTWWQFNPPTATGFGDLWVNTATEPATLYRWNNFDWIQVLDWSLLLQQQELELKVSTWYEPAPPVSRAVGDLWYDTTDQLHPYRAESVGATTVAAGQWVSVRDGAVQAAATQAGNALTAATNAMNAAQVAQAMADGIITSHYSVTPPWPAGSAQDPGKVGDLWLNTDNGQAYHWTGDDWLIITDNAVAEALLAAQNAQATADGKISGHYLPNPPWANGDSTHDPDFGDQWYDTDDGNKPYYWADNRTWAALPVGEGALAPEVSDAIKDSVSGYVTEYAVSASETAAPTTGWSTASPVRTPGAYIWFRTTVTRNDGTSSTTSPALLTGNDGAPGDTGPQGVPGPPGENGVQLYTWIKYADTPTTGMSDDPTGKAYMGLAYNKTSAVESSAYGDYQWTLIKGADGEDGDPGVPGPPGADGQPTYTWIKYATDASGTGLSDSPAGKTHIGLAYNKTTPVESSDPAEYQWALIQGPAGANARVVTLTATAQVLTAPAGGGATTPATATVTGAGTNTTIDTWDYSADGTGWTTIPPAGVSRTDNVVTVTGATMTARTIAVRMGDGEGASDTITVAKVLDGATGSTGGTGPAGADAYTVLLTNEAHTFPGSTTAALADSTTSQVLAFKGQSQVAATIGTITGQVTGLTTTIQNNGTATARFTVAVTTSLTTRSGELTVPVTVDGKTFTKKFAWALSLAGSTGVSVTSITPYYARVTAGAAEPAKPGNVATPPAPWVELEPAYAPNTELYRTERVKFSNSTYSYTAVVKSSSYLAAAAAAAAAAQALADAADAQATADGKVRSFFQTYPPTGLTADDVGDMWFDTNDGNKLYRWGQSSGTWQWIVSQDQSLANSILATTDSKILNSKLVNFGLPYKEDIIVYGDHDKYYPVLIVGGNQNKKRTIIVNRSFSELHPPEWYSSTHGGGLYLEVRGNFGGWGGAKYNWDLMYLEEQYNPTFGGAKFGSGSGPHYPTNPAHTGLYGINTILSGMGAVIFLRGGGTGGASYHFFSDEPLGGHPGFPQITKPTPFYNGDKVEYSSGSYTWGMPMPILAPDEADYGKRKALWLADSKITTFYQAGVPTALSVGDLWVDTDDGNKLYRALAVGANEIKAGEWVSVQDQTAVDALQTAEFAIGAANGKNKVTHSENTPGTTANAVNDIWFQHATSALNRVIGQWRGAGGTAWTKVEFDPVVIPQIDIGAGTFGSLTGNRIEANSIKARSLDVGEATNALPPLSNWNGAAKVEYSVDTAGPVLVIQGNGSGNTHVYTTESPVAPADIPVVPGEQFTFSWDVYANYSGYSGSTVAYFVAMDGTRGAGTAIYGPTTSQGTTSYERKEFTFTIPAGKTWLRFMPYVTATGKSAIRNPQLRRASGMLTVSGSSGGVRISNYTNPANSSLYQGVIDFLVNDSDSSTWTNGRMFSQMFNNSWNSNKRTGAIRITAPYVSSQGVSSAPYIDIRRADNLGELFVSAEQANFLANSFLFSSQDASAVDFTLQYSTKNVFSFRGKGGGPKIDMQFGAPVYGLPGNILMANAGSTGAQYDPTWFSIQAKRVFLNATEYSGSGLYAGSNQGDGGIAYFGTGNVGLRYAANGVLHVEGALGNSLQLKAYNVALVSDRSTKESVRDIEPGVLDRLRQTKVYEWSPKGANEFLAKGLISKRQASRRFRGIIADEAETSLPEIVIPPSEDDPLYGVDVYAYVSTLHAAIVELSNVVDELRTPSNKERS